MPKTLLHPPFWEPSSTLNVSYQQFSTTRGTSADTLLLAGERRSAFVNFRYLSAKVSGTGSFISMATGFSFIPTLLVHDNLILLFPSSPLV